MNEACQNCGAAVLAEDIACWQCGWPLRESEALQADSPAPSEKTVPAKLLSMPASLKHVLGTVIVAVLALVVLFALRPYPILQVSAGVWRGGWKPADSFDGRFAIVVPPTWLWADVSQPVNGEYTLDDVMPAAMQQAALAPLSGTGLEVVTRWIAAQDPDQQSRRGEGSFVLVAAAEGLGQRSPAQLVSMLREGEHQLLAFEEIENFHKSHLMVQFAPGTESLSLTCRHRFYLQFEVAYVVAACAPPHQFNTSEDILLRILDSFEPLAGGELTAR